MFNTHPLMPPTKPRVVDLRYCVAIFLVSQEVSLNFHRFCGYNCGWVGWGGDIQKLADIFPHRGLIGLLSSQR